tara:strand:+ start:969 stop:1538 length:570 start_codon:yes stop_codon:yes gene_type:complete
MINIIGGNNKKTKIEVPKGNNVRPTSSIKREAIFSILENLGKKNSYDIYSKYCFIDFFAGTGSLGLEAKSRGASFVYFFENDKTVIKTLTNNCNKIIKKNNYKIINKDILHITLKKFPAPISVIFIDPPYKLNPFNKLLEKLLKNNSINKKTIIVIETQKNNYIDIPLPLNIIDERIYGKTKILFIRMI